MNQKWTEFETQVINRDPSLLFLQNMLAENELNFPIAPEKLSRTFNRFYNLPRTFDELQKLNHILLDYLIKFGFHPAIYYLILENFDEMTDESLVKKFACGLDQKCHNSALEQSKKLKKNRLNIKLLRILTKFRRLNVLNENNCQKFKILDIIRSYLEYKDEIQKCTVELVKYKQGPFF